MIFSEKLKDPTTGKSYAKLAKPFETKKDVERKEDNKHISERGVFYELWDFKF